MMTDITFDSTADQIIANLKRIGIWGGEPARSALNGMYNGVYSASSGTLAELAAARMCWEFETRGLGVNTARLETLEQVDRLLASIRETVADRLTQQQLALMGEG